MWVIHRRKTANKKPACSGLVRGEWLRQVCVAPPDPQGFLATVSTASFTSPYFFCTAPDT